MTAIEISTLQLKLSTIVKLLKGLSHLHSYTEKNKKVKRGKNKSILKKLPPNLPPMRH